jgi:antirestriction protein ArdC
VKEQDMAKKKAATPGSRSKVRQEERRERDRKLAAEAVEQLRSSEGWQRWLATRRHFHRYSLRNQFLIAFQMPEASRVAGFKAWLGIGYAVRRGEHGILIWAPCRPSRKKIREWEAAGGDPKKRPRPFFRLAAVFDRSQVDPLPDFPGGAAPLEPPREPVEGDSLAWLFGPLCDFGELIGSPVRVEQGSGAGSYDKKDRRIRVDLVGEGFSPNAQVATTIHELAHALVRSDREQGDPELTHGEEEVLVECVAMAVCGTVGLDTSADSVPYMASWGTGEEIERYAGLVDRLARRLEDAVAAASMPTAAETDTELAVA